MYGGKLECFCRYTARRCSALQRRTGSIACSVNGGPFLWGVWVSLGQKSFDRYVETYDHPDTTDSYFGWLCTYLPYYECLRSDDLAPILKCAFALMSKQLARMT